MAESFSLKSRAVRRLLSVIMICALLPGSFAWGALQPPLSKIPVPEPANLGQFLRSGPDGKPTAASRIAAIQLGKALFWDMQAGSDGVTACASCHYRAGADPIVGTLPKDTAKRDKNQLHPGPDAIFGNNSTVIKTFKQQEGAIDPLTGLPDLVPIVNPQTGLPAPFIMRATGFPLDPPVLGVSRFAPNYTLDTQVLGDFPLFLLNPPTARLLIDPLTGLTEDAVTSLRDTNDVVGSQGIRLADFVAIIEGSATDNGTPIADQLFHVGNVDSANNVRRVTGRNSPSVINAVFNYTNFWDGRANNIFNGVNPLGPLDQAAVIYINNGGATLVEQKVAIPNSSLASQATGPPLDHTEMSFKGRTFPELGRKMLHPNIIPLGKQNVSPDDSVLHGIAENTRGLTTTYAQMIKDAFQDNLWNSPSVPGDLNSPPLTVNMPVNTTPPSVALFTQIEANFSLFWGLAIQLYEATLVSDRTPFDRFQAGNRNALSPDQVNDPNVPSAVRGFGLFDSKCTVCHSGSEFSSAVVGSNNCFATTSVIDCNRVAFTNNSTHKLIKQDVALPEPGAPPPQAGLIDTGFFNIGVRPTSDDPGRGGNAPFNNPLDIDPVTGNPKPFPLSFTRLAVQTGLPFVTPKLPLNLPDKVQGSFKTPGLRNVELTAPYFHNGDALTLDQVVEFYTRGGNFPGNPDLAAAMQPIGNLRQDPVKRADIVAFLKTLTDERVRNETAPFDHPQLMIPNGVDVNGFDVMVTLDATGGVVPDVPITTLTIDLVTSPTDLTTPVTSPTNLTSLVIRGTVDDTATVAVDITNITTGVSLPTAVATVGGTVADVVGGVAQLANEWSINLTKLAPGLNRITATATSITGATAFVTGGLAVFTRDIQVTPTAIINGTPLGGITELNSATLTIGGSGVFSYQYSLDGEPFSADRDILTTPTINLTNLPDATHTVAVLAKDAAGIPQPSSAPTTTTWTVNAIPPVLTLNPTSSPTGSSTQTISGTVELSPNIPKVTVAPPATAGTVKPIDIGGIATWSCDISGLVPGTNNITVTMTDIFYTTTKTGVITLILPDGDINEDGVVDIRDALKAMRIAVDLEQQPTVTGMLHGDIPTQVDGLPTQNNTIDIADALLILRKIVGLVTF